MTENNCDALLPVAPARRDLFAELAVDDGAHPPAWKPNVGEILVGTLLRYDRAPNAYKPGEATLVVVVRPDAGPTVAVWLGTVLLSLFRTHRPQPGDRLGLKRLSDSPPRPGKRSYARYVLRVDDGGRALDLVDGELVEDER